MKCIIGSKKALPKNMANERFYVEVCLMRKALTLTVSPCVPCPSYTPFTKNIYDEFKLRREITYFD